MSRKERIQNLLLEHLTPLYMHVDDESPQHHVPQNMQTHFKVTIVSPKFATLGRLDRHRLINQLLEQEFSTGLHALSLNLYTPAEWESRNKQTPQSPDCRGGAKKSGHDQAAGDN